MYSVLFSTMQSDDGSGFVILLQLAMGVLFGFICKGVYERKGRKPGWGFAIGFFLGLVGLIICALVPETDAKKAEALAPKADETKCPHCLEIIKVGASVCKHCGRNPDEAPQ